MSLCSSSKPFGLALQEACAKTGRLCVGIDPHTALMQQWGLEWNVAGLREFTQICVEAFAGRVALVKPQVAFFECFGSQGFAILEKALADLHDAGTLVVADANAVILAPQIRVMPMLGYVMTLRLHVMPLRYPLIWELPLLPLFLLQRRNRGRVYSF